MSQTTIVVAEDTTTAGSRHGRSAGHAAKPAATHGNAPRHEGGHKGAFPPMDATTFPSQIFWLVIFFALLYLLMSKLALPKMAAVLEKRHKTIEGDLAKASALKNETETAIQSYEKALADARAKAQGHRHRDPRQDERRDGGRALRAREEDRRQDGGGRSQDRRRQGEAP